jgi:hypothetical protein
MIFKQENTKFKRKVNKRSEGASIFIAPVSFASKPKLLFIRLERAIEFNNILEINIKSKFLVLILAHPMYSNTIFEIGRVIATCLADDVCYFKYK